MEKGIPPLSRSATAEQGEMDQAISRLCRFESYRLHHFLNLEITMKFLLLILILLPLSVVADNPYEKFDATRNMTNNTTVEWRQASNIQESCHKESIRRGLGGFKIKLEACSFWDKNLFSNRCLIITGKKTNLETLGHEIRHCFQGSFHG